MDVAFVHVPQLLDFETVEGFAARVADAIADGNARAVVLTGSGDGVFCRGLDLAALGGEPERVEIALRSFAQCVADVRLSARPTIAVVDGQAIGGGVGVAVACDVVVATTQSSFALPELLLGLVPAIVLPLLLERISPQHVRLLALEGVSVTATRALDLGLVDEVVEPETLDPAVRRWTRRLSRADPDAIGTFKRHLSQDLRTKLLTGAELTAASLRTPGAQSLLCAIQDGEVAPWLSR